MFLLLLILSCMLGMAPIPITLILLWNNYSVESEKKNLYIWCLELLSNLETLYIGNNKLSGTSSIQPLLRCKSLSTLDISKNMLSDCKTTLNLLSSIGKLSVLYLHGNPVVRNLDSYRFQITIYCVNISNK